jgi:hypothetical protein
VGLIDSFILPYIDFILTLLFAGAVGISLWGVLVVSHQLWTRNVHYLATFAILPVVSCGITSFISGNIALSLGMVGALSIVRFRHPVRSPMELTAYFALIAMGVGSSVSMMKTAALSLVIICIFSAVSILFSKFKQHASSGVDFSFDIVPEQMPLIHLEFSERQSLLDKSVCLHSYQFDAKDNFHNYTLRSEDSDFSLEDIRAMNGLLKLSYNSCNPIP